MFLLPNEVKHIKAIEQFLYAYEHAEQTEEIIRVLKRLYKEQLMTQMSDEAKKAVWNLLEYIESDQESQNFLVAVSYLIEKVGLEPLFSTDILASMYHARGYTYGMLEEYQRTIQKYNHAEVSVLDYLPALYLERADAYAVIEEYRRAIIDYSNAIKLEPKYALAYIRRGTVYRKLKEYEQAIIDLSYALKLEPKNAIAYAERGIAYRLQKKYERGLEDFSCALKLEPRNAVAYLDRGIAYLYIKDFRLAKADFNNSLELDSKNISAHWGSLWSEMCQEAANLKMATRLEVIASLDPDHYVAYVCRSVSLGLRGHLDEALKKLESIIASVPDEWDAYFWKGMVCAALRRDTEALAALEQALVLGLPPILLSPLRWLEKTRPDFYVKCAVPLLTSKE